MVFGGPRSFSSISSSVNPPMASLGHDHNGTGSVADLGTGVLEKTNLAPLLDLDLQGLFYQLTNEGIRGREGNAKEIDCTEHRGPLFE